MVSHIVWYLIVILFLVELNAQNLGKKTLFPGLGDELGFNSLRAPSRTVKATSDTQNLCHCHGARPTIVQHVQYSDQDMLLCICPNPVMNADYMIEMMGRVPTIIRRNVRAMISATAGTCGGAASSGDVINFCQQNMHISVFIHESAHSFDRGKSGTNEWHNAVARDSCVPDPYANTNYAEDLAQVAVVWASLIGKAQGPKYVCMSNQLQLMRKYTR